MKWEKNRTMGPSIPPPPQPPKKEGGGGGAEPIWWLHQQQVSRKAAEARHVKSRVELGSSRGNQRRCRWGWRKHTQQEPASQACIDWGARRTDLLIAPSDQRSSCRFILMIPGSRPPTPQPSFVYPTDSPTRRWPSLAFHSCLRIKPPHIHELSTFCKSLCLLWMY